MILDLLWQVKQTFYVYFFLPTFLPILLAIKNARTILELAILTGVPMTIQGVLMYT